MHTQMFLASNCTLQYCVCGAGVGPDQRDGDQSGVPRVSLPLPGVLRQDTRATRPPTQPLHRVVSSTGKLK